MTLPPNPKTKLAGVILSGGASSRMGTDKALLRLGGERCVDIVAGVARRAGCDPVIVSGPSGYGYRSAPDARPLGGPVGGVMAAIKALGRSVSRILFLAVDAPLVSPEDLRALIDHSAPGAAFEGFPLPFVFSVEASPSDFPPDWPLWRLLEALKIERIEVSQEAALRMKGANDPLEWRKLSP